MGKKKYTPRMIKMRMQLSVGYHLFHALIMADKLLPQIEKDSKIKGEIYNKYIEQIEKLVEVSDNINRYVFMLPDSHPIKDEILLTLEGEKVKGQV